MSTPVTLQVKLDARQAEAAAAELNKKVSGAFAAIREGVGKLNAQMKALVFDPAGILRGTEQATRGIEAATEAAAKAERQMASLQGASDKAGSGLASVGTKAANAGKKLDTLAGTGTAVGTAFGDLAKSAETADEALLSLEEGAASAQKSVAGLGRAASGTFDKIETLGKAGFDPAGVVAGADEATAALDRVKVAATETRASLRGAGSGAPILFGGGRHGSGRRAAEEAEAGTLGGGLRAGAGAAVDVAGGGAALVTLLAAVTGKLSAGFDNLLQGIRGNTTMSDADAAGMRSQTLSLMKTGTSETQLAQGYKHIANFGYHGQAAAQIADYGNKFGIGTHTDVEQTDDMLAGMMNANRHAPASQVSRYANMAHFAAAGSNMDVRDLEKNSTRTVGLAANYMGPTGLPDALAAYSALVQHRLNPARADTQVSGMIGQIAAPSPKAQKEAAKLGITSFNAEGLKRPDGLFQIIGEVKSKIAALPVNDQAAALKNLFNNKQGGIGASFLTGAAHASYDDALNNSKTGTKAAFAGKANAIDPAYNAQMKQTQQQFAALGGEIKSDFIPIGERLGPVFAAAIPLIRTTANVVKMLLDGFTKLPKPVQEAVLGLGALKLISAFLPMLGGFALVSERTAGVIGGLGKMLFGLGGAAAEGEAGLAGTAAVMSGPFALGVLAVVAAAAALALAWKSDFGGIRETTAKVAAAVKGFILSQFGFVVRWFQTNLPLIRETVKTVLTTMQEFWKAHGQRILAILGPLWSFIKTLFSAALHIILAVVKLGMDVMTGHWAAAGKDIGVIVANLWAVVRSLFVNGVKAVGNTLALIVDLVLDLGKRLFEAGLNAGQQAINGIVGGIKSGIGSVASAAKSMAASIPATVKAHLDIHSPSRVMQKLGLNTAEGLAQGIRDGKVSVEEASRLLASTPAAIVRNAIAGARRSQAARKKRASEVHTAGEFAATVAETPEQKQLHKLNEDRAKGLISAQQYHEAYTRIAASANKKAEGEAKRHAEALAQIHDGLQAFQANPETPSLDKQEITAHAEYRRQVKGLGRDKAGIKDAGTLLQDKLGSINAQRDAKKKAEDAAAAEEADAAEKQAQATTVQLNRELWQHAGGDMKAYFQSLRDEANDTLKGVTDKFGPASAHPNAPAVTAATAENAARLLLITQQQTDAENSLADARQQHDLDQGKISLADYLAYLTKRRDAYAQYSQEWLDLDSRVYQTDEEMQRKQLQSIEDLFQAHKINLAAYKKMLADLAAQVPPQSSVHQDVVSAANGAENKAARGEMVGGQDFWDGLAGSAAENGSKVLTALLHPKDKKSIFKSMWTDLLGSLESGATGGLSKILKNMMTGEGSGFNLGSLFGGLFGHGKKAAGSGATPGSTAAGSSLFPVAETHFLGGGGGKGLTANLLGALPLLSSLSSIHGINQISGINGPLGNLGNIGGKAGGSPGAMDIASLAASFIPGGGLSSLFTGGLFGGSLKKLFHFSRGGVVPGTGHGDTVPAMLTPGEMVLPKAISKTLMQQAALPQVSPAVQQAAGSAGANRQSGNVSGDTDASITIHQTGDHHYHTPMDVKDGNRDLARVLERARRGGVPAAA